MKKIYSIVAGLFLTASVFAQAPQKMSYQAVIRKSNNALVQSSPVGMKISILKGSATGTAVYVETQTATTNANGLVSLEIGTGTAITGTFAAINWGAGPYFIKTETDPNGGTAYTIAGTNELMSVPYALFSANGTPGPQGPAGATGPQGSIGLTGANGTNGIDGISVTNSNVIGDSLFITLSNGQVLSAGYVKGPQGIQGLTGATGTQGPIGLTGPAGIQGPIGLTGSTGATGATGPQGPIGLTGATGPQGPIGLTGPAGATGAVGPQGPIGLTGPAGPQGPIGITGANGATGVQGPIGLTGSAGAVGATGPAGPQGIQGLTGPAGATGAVGPQGPIGLTGPAGAIGAQGPIGLTGPTGPQGPIGITGPAGAMGPQGPIGLTGPAGPTGATGLPGATGPVGTNGISVTNSAVIGDSLFITLSNGQVLNAGYVKGPQGIQGLTGAQGPVGTGSFTHYIGEIFGGGVVFHLWKDAQGVEHGLIVDKTDLSISQVWSNVSILIGTSAQSIWDGLSNSNAIVAQAGHTSSAAALCLNSTNGGQSDWYLPSIQELSMLWNSYYAVARSMSQISGATQMQYTPYWSSTEISNNRGSYFDFGFALNWENKYVTLYVRAVRAF
jgi:hypothetical protein